MSKFDIVIIGAGVTGVGLAYHLREKGLRILVLERESAPGMHASGKNAGMFRHLYRNPYLTDWALRSLELMTQDIKELCFKQTGSIILGRTLPSHHRNLFKQLLIELNGEKVPALYSFQDGLLDPGALVNELKVKCGENIEFKFNSEVQGIEFKEGIWGINLKQGEVIHASSVVNSTGAWFNNVLPKNHPGFDIAAFRRHLFVSSGWEDSFILGDENGESLGDKQFGFYWDEINNWYVRDWSSGEKLMSVCEKIPANPESLVGDIDLEFELGQKIKKSYPKLFDSIKLGKSWYCYRTYTPLELPICGKDPYYDRLYHFGAFGGFGMSTSFAAALDMSNLIMHDQNIFPDQFSPKHFIVN